MEDRIYSKVINEHQIKRPVIINALKAFIIGGLICLISEGLLFVFIKIFKLEKDISISLMYICIIVVTSTLTGIGLFDKIGQFAGAGTIIPITGFSNSMTSCALESKSEGIILGILTNMFKLAGAVIASGVISSIIVGTIIYLFRC